MDEKLGIRFQKMQKCKIIHILHFFRKEAKNLFNAGFDRIWTLYTFRRLRYWFSIFVAITTIFTQQPNLEISWMIYKHSLNIQCSTVADKMKLFCCHGNQIYLVTKKILFLGQAFLLVTKHGQEAAVQQRKLQNNASCSSSKKLQGKKT